MQLIIYLFTSLPDSPKANYKGSTSKETNKTNTHKQTIEQGNVRHLDNNHSISAIMPTTMRREKMCIYTYTHTLILGTISILIINN
jgi:hypothetical protein